MFIFASIGSTLFFCTTFLSHLYKHELRFGKDALSKYALGRQGWIMSLGLYAIGLAEISLAVALATVFKLSPGTTLLAIAGAGAVLVATFKMEYPKKTYQGYIHVIGAGMQFVAFPLALLLLATHFTTSSLHSFTMIISSINGLLFLWIFYFTLTNTTHQVPYFGLIQKINILLMSLWVLTVSMVYIVG